MAAPDYVFTNIATARIDAESPGDETLFEDLADNDRHLEQWLGDAYTPAKDHDHDGVNSKQAQLPEYHWLRNRGSTTGTTTWSSNQTLTPGIHDYGNLTIQTGVTVSPSGSEAGPLIIRCNGTFTMQGTAKIDWDYKGGGRGSSPGDPAKYGLFLGGGGGGGGSGGAALDAIGGIGAQPYNAGTLGGSGGYNGAGGDGSDATANSDMKTLIAKLAAFVQGGGGGGGGGGNLGGNGRAGGGLVIIIAQTIDIGSSASIDARGDDGQAGVSGNGGGGGAGGGGVILLAASTFTNDLGTYNVAGGPGGAGTGSGSAGGDGGAGYKQSITIT